MVRSGVFIAVAAAVLGHAGTGLAQAPAQAPGVDRPALLEALLGCRSVTTERERLACYDSAAGELDTAERGGEIVVVERSAIESSRRQLFGFDTPSLSSLLGRGAEEEPLSAVETALVSARRNLEGRWIFTLANGSSWIQTDVAPVRFNNEEGAPVRVRRAALSSYMLTIGGSRAVRVRRQ